MTLPRFFDGSLIYFNLTIFTTGKFIIFCNFVNAIVGRNTKNTAMNVSRLRGTIGIMFYRCFITIVIFSLSREYLGFLPIACAHSTYNFLFPDANGVHDIGVFIVWKYKSRNHFVVHLWTFDCLPFFCISVSMFLTRY